MWLKIFKEQSLAYRPSTYVLLEVSQGQGPAGTNCTPQVHVHMGILTPSSAIVSDHCVEVVARVTSMWVVHLLDVGGEVKVREGEGDMAADLGGEVSVEAKPLEVDTENLGKPYYAHLFEAVLEAVRGKRDGEGKFSCHDIMIGSGRLQLDQL